MNIFKRVRAFLFDRVTIRRLLTETVYPAKVIEIEFSTSGNSKLQIEQCMQTISEKFGGSYAISGPEIVYEPMLDTLIRSFNVKYYGDSIDLHGVSRELTPLHIAGMSHTVSEPITRPKLSAQITLDKYAWQFWKEDK